ncbi:MAG: PAS domain S-box protein [Candidatus Delongbacteria bacterium]|jgi:PAS domain S-box-containing protein|nr:PAS domain S-box protein [Candidatus Delongbacteria bacterium]
MFKRLAFRTRLFIGFGSLLILMFISITISLNSVNKILDSSKLIDKHPIAVLDAIRNIETNTFQIHLIIEGLLLTTNKTQIDNYVNTINELDEKTSTHFNLLENRYLGNLNDIKNIRDTYHDWKIIRDEIFSDIKNENYPQAENSINSLEKDYIKLLSSKYFTIKEYASNKSKEYFNKIQSQESSNRKFLIYISFILFGIVVIITIIISNSISKPIHKILTRTLEQHQIELDKNVSKFDEQELLETTIDELNSYYKNINNQSEQSNIDKKTISEQYEKIKKQSEELEILNSELENKVLLRTEEVAKSFEELEKNKNILQSYFDSSPDPIIVLDEKAKLNFVSKSTLQIFGLDEKIDLSTVDIFDFIYPADKEIVGNSLNKLIKTGEATNPEIRMFKKDGSIINLQTNSSFIKNEEGKVSILIIAHDITERKKMEQVLRESSQMSRTLFTVWREI